jgi:dTDP-4-dehydrorhamnose reductase
MKILITGAGGLLGSKLISQWAGDPAVQVIATAIRPLAVPASVSFHLMDITHRATTLEVVGRIQPDVIIHAAAMTQVDACESDQAKCHDINVQGTRHVVEAAQLAGAYLLHISTDFIFDGQTGLLKEEATPNPINYYGQTKWEAEKLVQAASIPWAIARTVLVYGISPGLKRSNIILWVKENLEQGKAIKVVNDQWRTPTLAEDLAEGCRLMVTHRARGIYHISGKDFLTPFQMAQKTAKFFGLDASLIQEADARTFSQPAQRPPITGFDISKAVRDLGYQPHSFEDGISVLARQLAQG